MSEDIFSGKTVVCSFLQRGFSVNLPQHGFQRFLAMKCVLGTLTSAQSKLQTSASHRSNKEKAFLGPFFQDEKGHDSSLELIALLQEHPQSLDKKNPV